MALLKVRNINSDLLSLDLVTQLKAPELKAQESHTNVSSISLEDIRTLSKTLSRSTSLEDNNNVLLLTNIFYDFIKANKDINSNKRIFIIDRERFIKKHSKSKSILDLCDLIIEDVKVNCKCNEVNIIGGKLVDCMLGLDYSESSGDFDIWFDDKNFSSNFFYSIENNNNKTNFEYHQIDDLNKSCYSFIGKNKEYNEVKVQLICNSEMEDISDIFEIFDFLHCCVGYDGKNIFWRQGALKAIKQKNILINNVSSSRICNERISKYVKRGFEITYPNFILVSIMTLLSILNDSVNMSSKAFLQQSGDDDLLLLRSSDVY
jgi:hypothetical protein